MDFEIIDGYKERREKLGVKKTSGGEGEDVRGRTVVRKVMKGQSKQSSETTMRDRNAALWRYEKDDDDGVCAREREANTPRVI